MSSQRPLWRRAARDARRHPGRSLLVVLLVALPVAAVVGLATLNHARTPTVDQVRAWLYGDGDFLVGFGEADRPVPADAVDAGVAEHLAAAFDEALPPDSRVEAMPADMELGGVVVPGQAIVPVDGSTSSLRASSIVIRDGSLPTADEIALSQPLLDLLGREVGETVTIAGESRMVSGEIAATTYLDQAVVALGVPPLPTSASPATSGPWLVDVPDDASPEGVAMRLRDAAATHGVDVFVSSASEVPPSNSPNEQAVLALLGGMALVQTALIAAAALSVGFARQQREVALFAANGATPRVRAVAVLLQALLPGLVGAVVGAAAGFGVIAAVRPWLADWTRVTVPDVAVVWPVTIAVVVMGVAAVLAAGWLPARRAARLPVARALTGRRGHVDPTRGLSPAGLVAVGLGAGLLAAAVVVSNLFLLVVGAVVVTLGIGGLLPWVLECLGSRAGGLPLAGRLSLRDLARSRGRNAAVATAAMAALAGALMGSSVLAADAAVKAAGYQPSLRTDQVLVDATNHLDVGGGPGALAGLEDEIMAILGPDAVATSIAVRHDLAYSLSGDGTPSGGRSSSWGVGVVENAAALGVELGPDEAVILHEPAENTGSGSTPQEVGFRAGRGDVDPDMADSLPPDMVMPIAVHPLVEADRLANGLPSVVVGGDVALPAASSGMQPGPVWLARAAEPLDPEQWAAIDAAVERAGVEPWLVTTERGFVDGNAALRTGLVVVAVVASLLLLVAVMALLHAETRRDRHLLAAVGAEPATLRRVRALRGGVLGLVAGLAAIPAGLVPTLAVLLMLDMPLVVPWPTVTAIVILLPLVVGGLLAVPWGRPRRVPG